MICLLIYFIFNLILFRKMFKLPSAPKDSDHKDFYDANKNIDDILTQTDKKYNEDK